MMKLLAFERLGFLQNSKNTTKLLAYRQLS